MSASKQVYTQCNICGMDICYGNAVLEIERNVEQHDYAEDRTQQTVTVSDAELLLTSCARCGNKLSSGKKLWQLLLAELGLPGQTRDNDANQQTEVNSPETCECCGVELTVGSARVSLVKLIGQMDWSDARQDGELYVIDGEDLLSFCPACGDRMNSLRLQQALQRVLKDQAVPKRMECGISRNDTSLDGTPETPVKILHIGAEGGSITLYGWKDRNGEWQFSRDTNKSAPYCEDTTDLGVHHVSGQTGWHGALELLNDNPWYRHIPVYVHPEFAEQTMEALRNVPEENQGHIDYEAWQAVCEGEEQRCET